jgi:endonuclease/exonuclease/phosphatase family metal-dependent hydrolase
MLLDVNGQWGSLRFCSWNIGLTDNSPAHLIEARLDGVMQLTRHFDIICLQEVASHKAERQPEFMRRLSSRLPSTYSCKVNGAYATLIRGMDAVSTLVRVYPDAPRPGCPTYVRGIGKPGKH